MWWEHENYLWVCGVYQEGRVDKSEIIICNGRNDLAGHSVSLGWRYKSKKGVYFLGGVSTV